jgi:flagellar hook-associated protein 2
LAAAASAISTASAWTARTASSSKDSAATISVDSTAAATSFSLDVDVLATQQSASSATVAAGTAVGAGVLKLQLGTWSGITASQAADALVAKYKPADTAATTSTNANTAAANAWNANDAAATQLNILKDTTTTVTAYAAAYREWVDAIATNDHVTPALQTAEDGKLTALNNQYNLLGPDDRVAVDAVTITATQDASVLKGTAITAANALSSALATAGIAPGADPVAAAHTAYGTAVSSAQSARASFTAASSSEFEFTVSASDTVASVAAAINKANVGLVATPFFDGTQDRLLLKSKNTGEVNGFKLTANTASSGGTELFDNTDLSRLAFNPSKGAFGGASVGSVIETAVNAKVRINGNAMTSASNTLSNNIAGATITLAATTTTNYNNVGGTESRSPVTMTIKEDVTVAVKNVDNFVKAYNELVASLTDLTKYDAATKTAGSFQGDPAVNGLLSMLRNMVSSTSKSGSVYSYLSDVGIVGVKNQLRGQLTVDTGKLGLAANNGEQLRRLFVPDPLPDDKIDTVNGFANMFNNLAKGVLASSGQITNKVKALGSEANRNTKEQTKVNDRATAVEERLRKTYTALDTKMAGLTALNSYVAQQVTAWNKSTG